jgi:hypothetical protein
MNELIDLLFNKIYIYKKKKRCCSWWIKKKKGRINIKIKYGWIDGYNQS